MCNSSCHAGPTRKYSGDCRRNTECTTTVAQVAPSAPSVQRDLSEDPSRYSSYGFWAPTGTSGASPSGAGQVYSSGTLHPSWAYGVVIVQSPLMLQSPVVRAMVDASEERAARAARRVSRIQASVVHTGGRYGPHRRTACGRACASRCVRRQRPLYSPLAGLIPAVRIARRSVVLRSTSRRWQVRSGRLTHVRSREAAYRARWHQIGC